MNQIQNRGPDPEEITFSIQFQDLSIFRYSSTMNQNCPFIDFEEDIQQVLIDYELNHLCITNLFYTLGQTEIKSGEKKSLAQLGFKNNSELNVITKNSFREPENKYKFRIISKLLTFKLELLCHQDMNSAEFEQKLKKNIFEQSGLKANQDYDQFLFQVQSTFCPSTKKNKDCYIEDVMLENTTFDVILEPIDLSNG